MKCQIKIGISSFTAFSIVLYPFLVYYGYGFVSLAFLLVLLLFFYAFLKRGKICFGYPLFLLCYVMYFILARLFCNTSFETMIAPSIVFVFLYWGFLHENLCLDVFLRYYRVVAFVNIAFFVIQELMYIGVGYRILGILTFLPVTLGKGNFDVSQWAETTAEATRSSAFFSEPAHFVQFILPLLIVELFFVADKKAYIRCAVYLIILLALISGNALLGICIISLFFMVHVLKRLKSITAITTVCAFLVVAFISTHFVINSSYGENLLRRQEELDPNQTTASSGFYRIFRGYYIIDEMSPSEKLWGLNSMERLKNVISKSSASLAFNDENDTYMNAAQSFLIQTGYFGTALFICFLGFLWKGNNLAGKCCIITCVALGFIASIYFTHTMILFLITAFLMKRTQNKVCLKVITIQR